MSKSTSPDTLEPNRKRLRFPKSSRLFKKSDFNRVREYGKAMQGRFLRIAVLDLRTEAQAKIGFITSKRLGNAVIRNRVRRRLREIARVLLNEFRAGLLVVAVAKPAAAKASFEELREEWLLLVRRLSILRASA